MCLRMKIVVEILSLLTLLVSLQRAIASREDRPLLHKGFRAAHHGTLKCLPQVKNSEVDPQVRWIKPPKSSFKTRGYYKSNNTLEGSPVRSRDKGNYTCIATYRNGTTISQTFSVCVTLSSPTERAPEAGTITGESYAPEGGSITLHCKASVGTPHCVNPFNYTLTWSKQLREPGRWELLNSSEEIYITEPKIIENRYLNGYLTIKNMRSYYYGTYLCNITNEKGSLSQSVNVTDKVPLKILQERKMWIICGFIICVTLLPFWIYGLRHCTASITLLCKSLKANPSLAVLTRSKENGDKAALLGCVLVKPS